MGTVLRSEISEKSKYYISKHRYYELKHFCLQYPEWKKAYRKNDFWTGASSEIFERTNGGPMPDSTAKHGEEKASLLERMEIIEKSAKEAGEDLWKQLMKAVTEGMSYEHVSPPCCRQVWYVIYRRFFWILDKKR